MVQERIRTIVIDDEPYNLEEISDLVAKTGFLDVYKKYLNPLDALADANDIMPQVAFVDIELPGMNGLTLAERLLEIIPEIIIVFITSYNQYTTEAYNMNAFDYIMKPVSFQRFNRMIQRLKNELGLNSN